MTTLEQIKADLKKVYALGKPANVGSMRAVEEDGIVYIFDDDDELVGWCPRDVFYELGLAVVKS